MRVKTIPGSQEGSTMTALDDDKPTPRGDLTLQVIPLPADTNANGDVDGSYSGNISLLQEASSTASAIINPVSGGSPVNGCLDFTVQPASIGTLDLEAISSGLTNTTTSRTVFPRPVGSVIISAVFDADRSTDLPQGLELYAWRDVPDLSQYGIGIANDGNGSDGEEVSLPAISLSEGDYYYVSAEQIEFTNFFTFAPDFADPAIDPDGNDAVELYFNGVVTDVYGEPRHQLGLYQWLGLSPVQYRP